LKGFPFPDNSFDAAYSSHVLEHFTLEQGEYLLKEALRVLRPGGLLRIVVPDLETTLREFVRLLDCHDGSPLAEKRHEWITLELLDQLVRMENQGIVTTFRKQVLDSADEDLIAYVQSRAGDVFAAGADVAAEPSFRSKLAKASLGKLDIIVMNKNISQSDLLQHSDPRKQHGLGNNHFHGVCLKDTIDSSGNPFPINVFLISL
jgi:SAM-dependent methyltransferase